MAGCSTAMSDESARMMDLARRDLRAAQGMVADRAVFTDEIFGFHAQQAVEKACKALMCEQGIEYPKTHDLDLLFHLLAKNGSAVPDDYDDLIDLVDFSVQYRYEAFDEVPLDREQTLALVVRFVEYITVQLSAAR